MIDPRTIDPRPFMEYLANATSSPTKALGAYYGDLILPALDAPGKLVRETLSPGGDQDVFRAAWNQGGRYALANPSVGATLPAGAALGQSWANHLLAPGARSNTPFGGIPGLVAPQGTAGDIAGGMGELAGDIVFDPLTYVGSGVTKHGPRMLQRGERLLQTGIEKSLLAPALVPKALAEIPWPGFGLGQKFQRYGVDPATDGITKTASRSVGDFLWGGPSRESQLHEYSMDIQDIAETLMRKGHDLEIDMADFVNAQAGNVIPKYNPARTQTVIQEISRMLQPLRQSNPHEAQALVDLVAEYGQELRSRSASPEEMQAGLYKLADAVDRVGQKVSEGTIQGAEEVYNAGRRRMDALGFLEQGRTGILADLPDAKRTRAEVAFGSMTTHGQELIKGRETLEAGVKALWDLENGRRGGTLGAYNPIGGVTSGQDAINALNGKLQAMGFPPLSASKDVPYSLALKNFLAGKIDDISHNKIADVLDTWGASGDPLTDDAYKLVFDRTIRDRAHALGLDGKKFPGSDALNMLTTLWKTVQLMSPNYLATNALSGMASSSLFGVNPREIASNLLRNGMNMIRGRDLVLPELAAQNARLGLPDTAVPAGINSSTGFLADASQLRDFTGRGVDVLSRVGSARMAGMGALAGGAAGYARSEDTPGDDTLYQTAKGTLLGGVGAGSLPTLSRTLFQPLAQGTEHVLRSSALVAGRERFLAQQGDNLYNLITGTTAIPPQQADLLKQVIDQRAGQLSAPEVDEILRRASVPPEARGRIVQQWENVLQQANDAGTGLSNQINFDYQNLNNFEQFARQVFPFSTWGTKAIPMFGARLAEHPGIASAIARYQEESGEQREDQGLSPRFAGTIEGPAAVSDIWAALTGRPGSHAFFNPLRSFFPAADASRAMSFEPDDDASLYEHVNQLTQTIGLSEHPILGLLARLSGQAGTDPSQGIPIRQAGPLAAIAGTDLAAPGRILESSIRQGLGQAPPDDPRLQAALRRVDELAVKDTGRAITGNDPVLSAYKRAKLDRSGPIWERALRETDRDRGARSLGGFVSQTVTPAATLGPEEARISQARAGLYIPAELSRDISANAARFPHLHAPAPVVRAVQDAAQRLVTEHAYQTGGIVPDGMAALLADPTWRNLDRARDLIFNTQAEINPLVRGYAGSGSLEKQSIQQALQVYQDVDALVLSRPQFANMRESDRQLFRDFSQMSPYYKNILRRTRPGLVQYEAAIKSEREKILRENPALAAYFDYRKETGSDHASLEDFLDNVWPTQRRAPASR